MIWKMFREKKVISPSMLRIGRTCQQGLPAAYKCGTCMIGQSTLEDSPELRSRADNPLKQVNIDSFSSSVVYIEGYSHTVVIVDCHSEY